MSLIAAVEAEVHALAEHARRIEQEVLPGALATAKTLEDNPVTVALLKAAHVPPEALTMVVSVVEGLEKLYAPDTAAPAPAAA